MTTEPRVAPAAERNKSPIANVLLERFAPEGTLLEIASGFGQHAVYLAELLPSWTITPTDIAREHVLEIEHRRVVAGLGNLQPAIALNAEHLPWPLRDLDAVLNVNMIHISPWSASVGLLRGAGASLRPGGRLFTYGPYTIDGEHTAESNRAFEQRLRSMDPRFGIRDIAELEREAERSGLTLTERVEMPANNFTLVFERRP
ncbi:MAG: DUF938 domain-containing protein [Myxococcota bacterium]